MSQATTMGALSKSEYSPYFETYMQLVDENNVLEAMEQQIAEFREVLDSIDPEEHDRVHPPYSWTIKQVVGHILDNECIFGYRARRFASGDLLDLPGYEQDDYVANMDYGLPTLGALTDELEHARRTNIAFLKRIPLHAWSNKAAADGNPISVRAIAHLFVGHLRHHLNIIKRRIANT